MQPFLNHGLALSSAQTGDSEGGAIAPFPTLECLQTQSFLILTNHSWEANVGPLSCYPFKIFGWSPDTQDYTLCLFDASTSDLDSYAEFLDRGNHLLLYQCHPDVQICYSYRPSFHSDISTYPTQYVLQVFVCMDGDSWELIAEGEYR
ncbi:MAG TPA: hypothetical protein V6D07_11650 [Trichocoleus sp.]